MQRWIHKVTLLLLASYASLSFVPLLHRDVGQRGRYRKWYFETKIPKHFLPNCCVDSASSIDISFLRIFFHEYKSKHRLRFLYRATSRCSSPSIRWRWRWMECWSLQACTKCRSVSRICRDLVASCVFAPSGARKAVGGKYKRYVAWNQRFISQNVWLWNCWNIDSIKRAKKYAVALTTNVALRTQSPYHEFNHRRCAYVHEEQARNIWWVMESLTVPTLCSAPSGYWL